ncbi:glucose transporter type 1 isoform X3 [Folsomia candida]|uniref:glucose transporter type 1 isoform X3 n=1 Tax=Folsomia candida TaxID=158441 RepID=UPI0016052B5D|nr:glucose transporter type 1 isoform X3 [Folsomia candida]
MNNNVAPTPGSQQGTNGVHNHQSHHPAYATILRTNSQHSAIGGQGGGGGAGHHTLGVVGGGGGGSGGPSAHYFRPIAHPHGIYTGRPHDDFDITSDSDAISSPTSSIIGPPPIPPGMVGGGGRPPSPPHHLLSYPNGGPQPPSGAPNPPGFHTIYSPTAQSGSGPLRFDESSFLGTSDACSSPETGSLPRSAKLTKRKRPPRPPPRRLKSEDYTLQEEERRDHHIEDDDDPHLRHLIASGRCIEYGSWPPDSGDSPSPVPGYGYQQQLAMMTMNRLDEMQVQEEKLDTAMALSEIRTQLQELTKSVESCQTEGLTFFLCFSIFAAVLGMLQFGYNTGVINAPKKEIENFMKTAWEERNGEAMTENKLENLYSVFVSIFAIGGMLGGFSGGIFANRFGRKGGLLLNNLLGIGGGILLGVTKSTNFYELLILGRFIIGVNCGLSTSLVPMYVSEIAPLNLRGALGTVNQLAVTVGLLVSQVLGIEQLLGTEEHWPLLLGLAVVPPGLQLLLLPMCPESPRYLLLTLSREDEARSALKRFRATTNVEEDVEEMRAEQRAHSQEERISMLQLLRSRSLRMPLLIAVVMQLSQQLSGINAVFYFSSTLFQWAGLDLTSAKFATIGIGAIMVGMTLVSIMLMDRAGRRTLHLYGLGGMFIFSIFITISLLIKQFFAMFQDVLDWVSYLAVIFTLAFVVFFAVGPGSIPWMITAELFSQGPRPAAMSIAVLMNWFCNWLVGTFFLRVKMLLGNYVFLPFSVLLAFFWVFTYNKVPETKNRTFEEIANFFKRNANRAPTEEDRIYGMLNCVNTTGHPGGGGPESSALIEEKLQPPAESSSGRSSRGDLRERVGSSDQNGGGGPGMSETTMSPPPSGGGPPPPVPFAIPPYPPARFLDDNAV